MVYCRDLYLGLCCLTEIFLTLQVLLMIPLLTNECRPTLNKVMNNLEITTENFFEWFSFNNLKADASKCHFFISSYQPVPVNFRGSIIESSNCKKLIVLYIDNNFSFKYYIRISRKASQKLHAFSRISKYISEDRKRMLFKFFFI